jgi:hypothetical protein
MIASEPDTGVALKCAAAAAVATAVLLAWQAFIVFFGFGGAWTALFMTGDSGPAALPPALVSTGYVFKHNTGFDGQYYRYVAHDPLFRHGLNAYMDLAPLRYQRILVPGLAWLLAGGRPQLIDASYIAVIFGFVWLGAWWLARLAAARGLHPAWGAAAFSLMPATLISVNRMTVDVALAAFCAGFVWYAYRDSPRWLYAIAVLAPLVRETGALLTVAACLYALLNRRWLRAMLFATAAAPTWFWYRFVGGHLDTAGPFKTTPHLDVVPFSGFLNPFLGIVQEFGQLPDYPLPPWAKHLAQSLDVVALIGVVVATGFAFWQARRARSQPESLAAALFALLVVGLSYQQFWVDINGYGRTATPLVLMVAMRAASGESLWSLAPCAMLDLRLSVQLGSQTWTALQGLVARLSHF